MKFSTICHCSSSVEVMILSDGLSIMHGVQSLEQVTLSLIPRSFHFFYANEAFVLNVQIIV